MIEYEGTNYHGFQLQPNAVTVQGVLEQALQKLTGKRVRIRGAGRTDTGVHARGQVAAFETDAGHEPGTFMRAANHYLPEDVSVRAACEAPEGFDPRRQATSRRYRYLIANRPARPALDRARALWIREPLQVEAMDQAARRLEGEHDFASFSGPLSRPGSTVRRVRKTGVIRDGCMVSFEIEATAFLPQQVRRTVCLLLDAGKGESGPERIQDLLAHPVRGAADQAAPPYGLYLEEVSYAAGLLKFSGPQGATL